MKKMFSKMLMVKERLSAFRRDEEGATMIEYALIAALISIAAIALFSPIGAKILATFQSVLTALGG